MDDTVKIQIGVAALEALFKYGLPAMLNFLTLLNNKEKITIEEIKSLRGELDSANYFIDPTIEQ